VFSGSCDSTAILIARFGGSRFQRSQDDANYIITAFGDKRTASETKGKGVKVGFMYNVRQILDNCGGTGIDMLELRARRGIDEIQLGGWEDRGADGKGAKWDEYPQVYEACGKPEPRDDGIFWIQKDDFFDHFQTIYVCAKDMKKWVEEREVPSFMQSGHVDMHDPQQDSQALGEAPDPSTLAFAQKRELFEDGARGSPDPLPPLETIEHGDGELVQVEEPERHKDKDIAESKFTGLMEEYQLTHKPTLSSLLAATTTHMAKHTLALELLQTNSEWDEEMRTKTKLRAMARFVEAREQEGVTEQQALEEAAEVDRLVVMDLEKRLEGAGTLHSHRTDKTFAGEDLLCVSPSPQYPIC